MDLQATPPPAVSPPSPPSPLPRSGLDSMLSKLPGTAVQFYALYKLAPALMLSLASPADDRWKWVLLGFVGIVAPALVSNAFDIARQFLSKRI